jgi:hypothetical protein
VCSARFECDFHDCRFCTEEVCGPCAERIQEADAEGEETDEAVD